MEHDEKPLPIDIRLLGALAEKVPFYLSLFHYRTACAFLQQPWEFRRLEMDKLTL